MSYMITISCYLDGNIHQCACPEVNKTFMPLTDLDEKIIPIIEKSGIIHNTGQEVTHCLQGIFPTERGALDAATEVEAILRKASSDYHYIIEIHRCKELRKTIELRKTGGIRDD